MRLISLMLLSALLSAQSALPECLPRFCFMGQIPQGQASSFLLAQHRAACGLCRGFDLNRGLP